MRTRAAAAILLLLTTLPAAADEERFHRSRNHYKDWYFVAVDEQRLDVRSRDALKAFAHELEKLPGVNVAPDEFMDAPRGLEIMGPEDAVLQVLKDPRVKWIEEVGSFVRPPEPVPGQYIVELVLPRGRGRPSEEEVTVMAHALLRDCGGHLRYAWAAALTAFAAEDMTDSQARAMSEDPRVLRVSQSGITHLDPEHD
jgi:hypothetical protein